LPTSTPPQNIREQHPTVVKSPQIVESKTTSSDTTQIQASPQSSQLPTSTPPQNIREQHPTVVESPQIVESKTISSDNTQIQASPQEPTSTPPQNIVPQYPTVVESAQQPTASESLSALPNTLEHFDSNVKKKNSLNTLDGEMRSHFPVSESREGVHASNAFINDSTEMKEDLPQPQGYAVGGHVTVSNIISTPKITRSDTVPAMPTSGEFVVNAKDTEKNLNLRKHINTSGIVPDDLLTSPPSINKSEEQADAASVKTSTKVESLKDSPVQRKSSDERGEGTLSSLVSSSPFLKTEKQGLTTLSPLQSNSSENKTTKLNESSTHYSSTPLIFRKRISTPDSSSYSSNSPSQWTSIEELANGSNRAESSQVYTPLNFVSPGFHHQNSATSTKLRSPKASAQNLIQRKSFANGKTRVHEYSLQSLPGGVSPRAVALPQILRKSGNPPDTFTPVQPITETIESPSYEPTDTDSCDLETLAREIYHRLRQRLELERERHGRYSGRLPW
ncbi:MAG: hypothetical protein PUP91_21305, partial [Rhizonema sp. PD37]|nr:hypothetical protein [Rhizonema sp. PD37]